MGNADRESAQPLKTSSRTVITELYSQPLNLAKITRPITLDIVERSRLYNRFDDTAAGPVVWISGPAGSGKTTLVAAYLRSRERSCLWYQVGPGDDDPASLFHFLSLAAQKNGVAKELLPPAFAPDYLPGIRVFARRFFRELCSRTETPFALVFDNVQDVAETSAFADILREGLTQIPPGGMVFLISRAHPPAALSSLRATRQMLEVGWDALRFTDDESVSLIGRLSDRPMARETIASIVKAAAGWAAGLILLTARPHDGSQDRQTPLTTARGGLFDYFASEVFAGLDAAQKRFLVGSALAPEFTAELASVLTGEAEAEVILDRLVQDGFFTTRRGGSPTIYQYHPLFREFLVAQAAQFFSQDKIVVLRNRSARLLEEAGQVEAASNLYAESGNWNALAQNVCKHAPRLVEQGRFQTLASWVERLPPSITERDAVLLFWHGVSRLFPRPPEGRAILERAYALAKETGQLALQWEAWSIIIETVFNEMNDLRPLDPWIAELKAFEASGGTFPDVNIEGRVLNSAVQAIFHRSGLDPDLPRYADRAFELAKETEADVRKGQWPWILAAYYSWTGQLTKSSLTLDTLQPLKSACSPRLWLHWKINEVHHGWLWASFDLMEKAKSEALAQIEDMGVGTAALPVHAMACAAALSRGDLSEAAACLERVQFSAGAGAADRHVEPSFLRSWIYLIQAADFDLLSGNAPAALRHAAEAAECAVYCGSFWETLSVLLRARCVLEIGDHRAAEQCFEQAVELADRHRLVSTLVVALAGASDLARRQDDHQRCETILRRAFAIARQHSIRNGPFWNPKQMADACVVALEAGIEMPYVCSLIRERDLRPTVPPRHLETWPWTLTVRTLGDFEIRRHGEPVGFSRKTPRKTLDLLKALIAFGGHRVRIERLMDALWPDADGDAAQRAFHTTLHRLRTLLKIEDAIMITEGRLTLSPHLCWVDTWCLADLITTARRLIHDESQSKPSALSSLQQRTLALYRGPFLDGLDDAPWALPARRETAAALRRFLTDLGRFWDQVDLPDAASQCRQAAAAFNRDLEP